VTLHFVDIEPSPLEIEPRPCRLCGFLIDRHEREDTPEGPLFYCIDFLPDEMTLPELERRAELIRLVEVAEIMARMEAADVPCEPPVPTEPRPSRTSQATIDAFWWAVGAGEPERFKAWLSARPADAPFLLKLLEDK
jgi:hypothetical protein